MNSYPIKSAVRLSVTFTDLTTNQPVDPTTVKLRVMDPTKTEMDFTGTILHPSTGVYQQVIVPTVPGVWKVRWEATGAVIAASEKRFEVQASSFELD